MRQSQYFKDFFRMTQTQLVLYGLGFILAGFLTLAFPYLLIGIVVVVLFLIGATLMYFAWKMGSIRDQGSDTIIVEQKDDEFHS